MSTRAPIQTKHNFTTPEPWRRHTIRMSMDMNKALSRLRHALAFHTCFEAWHDRPVAAAPVHEQHKTGHSQRLSTHRKAGGGPGG